VTSLDVSPEGDRLLYTEKGQLYIGDAPSGLNRVPLTAGSGDVDWGRFAPTGDWVAYVTTVEGGYTLWRHPLDGEPTELHFSSTFIGQPTVDPTGARIVFVGAREGTRDLYLLDVESSEVRRLTTTSWLVATPDFSPDGQLVAFVGLWGESWDLFVLDVERGEMEQLTEDAYFAWCPRFSPDGAWIAFESRRNGVSHIYIIRRDGTALTRFTLDDTAPDVVKRNAYPAWYPDGEAIVYASDRFSGWVFLADRTD